MSYDPRAVANYLLDIADDRRVPISNLSLQKIVFFAHADFLRTSGKPLVNKPFEAWKYGPVSPMLYHEFKEYGEAAIKGRAKKLDFETGEPVTFDPTPVGIHHEFLTDIFDTYGSLSASALVSLSHAPGSPWDIVWNKDGRGLAGLTISDRIILTAESKNLNSSEVSRVN